MVASVYYFRLTPAGERAWDESIAAPARSGQFRILGPRMQRHLLGYIDRRRPQVIGNQGVPNSRLSAAGCSAPAVWAATINSPLSTKLTVGGQRGRIGPERDYQNEQSPQAGGPFSSHGQRDP
jgi:hypothetical protein